MIARSTCCALGLATLVIFTGCRKGEVESYRIPKEKDPEMPAMTSASAPAAPAAPPSSGGQNDMASTPVATASGSGLAWTAPAEWKPKTASAMRKGSYAVPGSGGEADLAITAFPGDVGGELANVNRWRGQLQLSPIAAGELEAGIQRIEHNGLKFGVIDITAAGEKPQRILGAYAAHAGATWFFKLTGPQAVVESAKPAFLAFLATVKPNAAATP